MHDYTVTLNYIISEANQAGNHVVENYALQLDNLLYEEKVNPRFIEMTLEFLEGITDLRTDSSYLDEIERLNQEMAELEDDFYEAKYNTCDCDRY